MQDRQKRNREVSRLLDENEAINAKLRLLSKKLMSVSGRKCHDVIFLHTNRDGKLIKLITMEQAILMADTVDRIRSFPEQPQPNSGEAAASNGGSPQRQVRQSNAEVPPPSPSVPTPSPSVPTPPAAVPSTSSKANNRPVEQVENVFKIPKTPISRPNASRQMSALNEVEVNSTVCARKPEKKKLVANEDSTPPKSSENENLQDQDPVDTDDQLMPLKRANSVKNRIQVPF